MNIIDNGRGIQPQYLDRIFEPFFSTKKNVYGTGLGLSISYGIIADHKGTIEVESDPGERTIMKILIPWTIDEAIENGEKG